MLEVIIEVLEAYGRALKVCFLIHSLLSSIVLEAFSAGPES